MKIWKISEIQGWLPGLPLTDENNEKIAAITIDNVVPIVE